LIVGMLAAIRTPDLLNRFPRMFWVCAWGYLMWSLVEEAKSGNPLPMYAIGLASAIIPLVHFAISARYYDINPRSAMGAMYACASAWMSQPDPIDVLSDKGVQRCVNFLPAFAP
jgi:hypothetical protein